MSTTYSRIIESILNKNNIITRNFNNLQKYCESVFKTSGNDSYAVLYVKYNGNETIPVIIKYGLSRSDAEIESSKLEKNNMNDDNFYTPVHIDMITQIKPDDANMESLSKMNFYIVPNEDKSNWFLIDRLK